MKNKLDIRSIVFISLSAALCAVCSWITIPFAVPFTLQTFAVFFALEFLGGLKGLISISVYIALGAVGVPVFSGFSGGIGHIAGPTGGYIVGFLGSALVFILFERIPKRNVLLTVLSRAISLLVCYGAGSAWFSLSTGRDWLSSVTLTVLPFILPDGIKMLLAYVIAEKLKKIIPKKR